MTTEARRAALAKLHKVLQGIKVLEESGDPEVDFGAMQVRKIVEQRIEKLDALRIRREDYAD